MSAPQDLHGLQRQWDQRAGLRRAARRPVARPSLLASWADLCRQVTPAMRRELLAFALMTPGLLWLFAVLWWALPA